MLYVSFSASIIVNLVAVAAIEARIKHGKLIEYIEIIDLEVGCA